MAVCPAWANGLFHAMSAAPIMDAVAIERALTRMAHEIVEGNPQSDRLAFIGIRTHGVPMACRLAVKVGAILKQEFPTGELDISMHRDDLALRPKPPRVGTSNIPFDVTGKTIVLVDDVLFTGRTIRAALDEITDFGRPQRIQLGILIDRGHRELPIRPDFVGKNVPSAVNERVRVHLVEVDGKDEVLIEK
jgi:pyrimidine operon attenuation protein/uracil phosphoribosyltransferase